MGCCLITVTLVGVDPFMIHHLYHFFSPCIPCVSDYSLSGLNCSGGESTMLGLECSCAICVLFFLLINLAEQSKLFVNLMTFTGLKETTKVNYTQYLLFELVLGSSQNIKVESRLLEGNHKLNWWSLRRKRILQETGALIWLRGEVSSL